MEHPSDQLTDNAGETDQLLNPALLLGAVYVHCTVYGTRVYPCQCLERPSPVYAVGVRMQFTVIFRSFTVIFRSLIRAVFFSS